MDTNAERSTTSIPAEQAEGRVKAESFHREVTSAGHKRIPHRGGTNKERPAKRKRCCDVEKKAKPSRREPSRSSITNDEDLQTEYDRYQKEKSRELEDDETCARQDKLQICEAYSASSLDDISDDSRRGQLYLSHASNKKRRTKRPSDIAYDEFERYIDKVVGKNQGVEIWRIDKSNEGYVPHATHIKCFGELLDDTSYIILQTKHKMCAANKYRLFVRYGGNDEEQLLTATRFTEYLDKQMNRKSKVFREEQGSESRSFHRCFKSSCCTHSRKERLSSWFQKQSKPQRVCFKRTYSDEDESERSQWRPSLKTKRYVSKISKTSCRTNDETTHQCGCPSRVTQSDSSVDTDNCHLCFHISNIWHYLTDPVRKIIEILRTRATPLIILFLFLEAILVISVLYILNGIHKRSAPMCDQPPSSIVNACIRYWPDNGWNPGDLGLIIYVCLWMWVIVAIFNELTSLCMCRTDNTLSFSQCFRPVALYLKIYLLVFVLNELNQLPFRSSCLPDKFSMFSIAVLTSMVWCLIQ